MMTNPLCRRRWAGWVAGISACLPSTRASELSELSDRMLEDIGCTRADVPRALRRNWF